MEQLPMIDTRSTFQKVITPHTLRTLFGVSLKEQDKKSGLSAGVKGVTEDTASLIASYMNSMRADGAKRTELLTKYIDNIVPKMSAMAKAQLVHLASIVDNTRRNAEMAEEIWDLLNSVTSGVKQFKIK